MPSRYRLTLSVTAGGMSLFLPIPGKKAFLTVRLRAVNKGYPAPTY
jgi:hypothetical protein